MIKEEKLFVKINLRNLTHYVEKGYLIDNFKMNKKILLEVDIEDVPTNSKERITAVCELCGSENDISIQKYFINYNRGDKKFYSCFKCKNVTKEKTCLEKYGVVSYSKTNEFKETESKRRKGNVEISKKVKKTCLERYGVESYFQTEKMKELNKIWMSSDEFKSKSKETMDKKYGGRFCQSDLFKSKIEEKKEQITEKIKSTVLERFNVEWISHSDEVQKKIKTTKISKGILLPDSLLDDFYIYRKKVRNVTNKYVKQLFEEWDGIDHYDGELIKGNFCYGGKHRLYPTIDHKISIFYGFVNNIEPEKIGNISNLCITKRMINSKKRSLVEEQFVLLFNKENMTSSLE